jgi:hypothetical protein
VFLSPRQFVSDVVSIFTTNQRSEMSRRFADIRVKCVSLIVNTASRGGRKIERLLPRMASRTQSPVPPALA